MTTMATIRFDFYVGEPSSGECGQWFPTYIDLDVPATATNEDIAGFYFAEAEAQLRFELTEQGQECVFIARGDWDEREEEDDA